MGINLYHHTGGGILCTWAGENNELKELCGRTDSHQHSGPTNWSVTKEQRKPQQRVSNPARLGVKGFRCFNEQCFLVWQSTLNEICENCGGFNESEKPR